MNDLFCIGSQGEQGAHEALQLRQQLGVQQPSYDCGLPDDAGGIELPSAPTPPSGLQMRLLDAAVQQLHTVSAHEAPRGKSQRTTIQDEWPRVPALVPSATGSAAKLMRSFCTLQALGRKQEVRLQVLQLKSEAAAQQLELAQHRRFEDSGVLGVQCLPYTRTPDLLQVN